MGPPIVPRAPGVPRTASQEDPDQGAGLEPTTVPAASTTTGTPATAPTHLNAPKPGTSASIRFGDDVGPIAREAAGLSPQLQKIISNAKRIRKVSIDTTALRAPLGAANVSLELFPGVTVALETTVAPSEGALGSVVYAATGERPLESNIAHATIIDDSVQAAVWANGTKYGIEPLGNGQHLVFEEGRQYPADDEGGYGLHSEVPAGPQSGAPSSRGGLPREAAVPVIDVMVMFDEEAQAFYGSVGAATNDIIEMINVSNVTYFNSLNDQQLALTNVFDTGYTPNAADNTLVPANYRNAIGSKTDGVLDNIHTVRDNNSADLVAMISDLSGTGLCGIAFFPTSATPAESNAYSVSDADCAVSNLTFPHELGHNMCAAHNPESGTSQPCGYVDGFGHISVAADRRTVMATEAGCSGCQRIPNFSNPNVTVGAFTTGINGARDNSRVLEDKDVDISSYRNPANSPAIAGVDGVSCVFNTVADAITLAPAGSTIFIAPGAHPGPTADVNYNVGKDLDLVKGTADCEPTVGGSSTSVVLTLQAASTVDAVLEVFSGADVRLDRITVQGGNSAEGTVFVDDTSSVTLDDAVVRNGDNPSASVGGGGVRVDANALLTSINDSQIENNSAVLGGGVYADDGTVIVNGPDNVELNDASDGGGIYGTDGAAVSLAGDADILSNTATSEGGGVYLSASTMSMVGASTFVGFTGTPNDANLGGGVFATGVSTVTVNSLAAVRNNTANFGGGIYGLTAGTTVRVNASGVVTNNSVSSNGAGILVTQGALADLNARSTVSNNSATGFGGGLAVFTPATLDADGGSPFDPVRVTGNTAGNDGGGIWATGTVNLDTVYVHNNTATTEGGGLFATGTVNITENFSCQRSTLGFEQYCNEFRGNTSGTTGGAIFSSGAAVTAVQVGFIANEADGGAVIMALGASDIDLRASVAISNTETVAAGDSLVTAQGTTALNLVGVTFADHTETFLDTDASATATVSRVLTTTGTLGLVATPAGTCNLDAVPADLPGLTVADPQLVTKDNSDYMPDADSPAVDACALSGGHNTDSRDNAVRDGDGVNSPTEYDIGGHEAPTPK